MRNLKKLLAVNLAIFVLLFCFSACGKNNNETESQNSAVIENSTSESSNESYDNISKNNISENSSSNEDSSIDNYVSSFTDNVDNNLKKFDISDVNVKVKTDFAHIDNDIIRLGNEEGATVTIQVDKPNVNSDDLAVLYDGNYLDIDLKNEKITDNCSIFEFYVTGKTPCNTELWILSSHDYDTLGNDATGYVMDITKYDSVDGEIVYVTPTGEKFHCSAECAGENAIATTYGEVCAYEMECCSKCNCSHHHGHNEKLHCNENHNHENNHCRK